MAIAGMDSASLFQMKTVGANSDISGTIALMAALDALLQQDRIPITSWKRHPVFLWFDAEHWGNLGSTHFIKDLRNFTCNSPQGEGLNAFCADPWAPSTVFQNINYSNIHSIVEPKQVGAPSFPTGSEGALFVHQQSHSFDTPAANAALHVKVPGLVMNRASTETPNVPPSSLLSFINADSGLAPKGIVITDHVAQYKNKFYSSIFDTYENVDPTLICKAASAIAQVISALGRDVDPSKDAEIGLIQANCTLVNELLDCFTRNNSCTLRQEFLPGLRTKKTNEFPSHYSSVYAPEEYSEHSKFIHDWVADRTTTQQQNETSACNNNRDCSEGSCVRNRCLKAESTFYHVAKNPNCYYYKGDLFRYYGLYNESDTSPFWTESDWTPIGLRVFLVSDPAVDYVFLGVALVEMLVVIAVSFAANRFFSQKFKVL